VKIEEMTKVSFNVQSTSYGATTIPSSSPFGQHLFLLKSLLGVERNNEIAKEVVVN